MRIERFLKTNKKLPVSLKVVINILVLGGKFRWRINNFVKAYGVSEPQFNVLRILRGQDEEPANLQKIQKRMVHRTSNTTRHIDKLVEKELVERIIPKENRREVEITITQKGLDLLAKIDPHFTELENRMVANLDEKEVKELNRLLEKIGEENH